MSGPHRVSKSPSPTVQQALLLLCVAFVACGVAKAQAAAEYAGASSVSAGTGSQAKAPGWTAAAPATGQSVSPHLAVSPGPPPEIANRQALEQRAGKDAGKLLLRSIPSGARVWINGAFLGNTPTLLVLAPGKYRLQMRGERLDSAERVVDLMPRETRELALSMAVRYPTRVSIR